MTLSRPTAVQSISRSKSSIAAALQIWFQYFRVCFFQYFISFFCVNIRLAGVFRDRIRRESRSIRNIKIGMLMYMSQIQLEEKLIMCFKYFPRDLLKLGVSFWKYHYCTN